MSSITLKIGSLLIRTLSKPIAVESALEHLYSLLQAHGNCRIASRHKRGSMKASAISAHHLPRRFTKWICDCGSACCKIRP